MHTVDNIHAYSVKTRSDLPLHALLYYTVGKKIIESTRGIHSAMVQNPIYEGPLYETLETQFNNVHTLTAATKNTSLDHSPNTAVDEAANNYSSHSSPTLCYVEQPRQTCVPQSISHAHVSLIEGHSTNAQCYAFQHSQQDNENSMTAVPVDMEEKYMIMTQANTASVF